MKNLLTRGGIEFIAVLLGISISLWIEKNNQASELNDKIEEVHNIVLAEVSELLKMLKIRLTFLLQFGRQLLCSFVQTYQRFKH